MAGNRSCCPRVCGFSFYSGYRLPIRLFDADAAAGAQQIGGVA